MIKKRKFSAENAEPQVEDVVKVNVLDENGNPVDETELTEKQIEFCAKVAGKVYKKFAASKTIRFCSETDSIDVKVPESDEDLTPSAVNEQVNEIVENAEPAEVEAEVELDLPEDETEVKEFSRKRKAKAKRKPSPRKRRFSAVDEVEELEDDIEEAVQEIEDIDGYHEAEKLEDEPEDSKSSAAVNDYDGAIEALQQRTSADDVKQFQAKAFAAMLRK